MRPACNVRIAVTRASKSQTSRITKENRISRDSRLFPADSQAKRAEVTGDCP